MYANKTPHEQLINHSLYSQKILELDPIYGIAAGSPPKEYLTKIMNDEVQSFCPINYDNCLLDGMELLILGWDKSIIHFRLLPGIMILDNIIFEQIEHYDFVLDLSDNINDIFDSMLFMFVRNKDKYDIKSFLLNDGNIISNNINEYDPVKNLPFRYIKIQKLFDIEEYSNLKLNDSFRYYPKLSINFEQLNNIQFTYRNIFHIKYNNNERIYNVVSGLNRYSIQKIYNIQGQKLKVPRYNIIEENLQSRLIDWYNQYYRNNIIKNLAFNRPRFQNFQLWKQK